MIPPVTLALDADRLAWLILDDPTSRANVVDPAFQKALAAALDEAEKAAPRALIFVTGKEKIFLAGADLTWLGSLADADHAADFSRRGQALYARIAHCGIPSVCAIQGACAGGGFELALACTWRIATDAPVTRIGLPEVSLGTIPGWGGCVRLPQLIGPEAALAHILRAQLLPAADALTAGLVDELVAPADLRARAREAALQARCSPARRFAPVPDGHFAGVRQTVLARTHGHEPAPLAVIDVFEKSEAAPLQNRFEIEAAAFGQVTAGTVCKNLLHAFAVREAAKKRTLDAWFSQPDPAPPRIVRVGVVGAGVMGSGIAQWLATHGLSVVLRDVDQAVVDRGLAVIRDLGRDAVKRGKLTEAEAEATGRRITTTTRWDGFAECDLVIEAIVENTALKRAVFSELATVVRSTTVLASNTSALPIEEIAGHVPNPERTIGLHFFNPVSRMPLVELVIGSATNAATAGAVLAFVKAIGKSPVICRSSPGFLVTRVLFFYLNEAARLWEEGVPTEKIDAAWREFGWPMGPLRLIDEVGVDVTDFIFREMAHYFPDRFTPTTACARLLAAGRQGRKNGASSGFYRYGEHDALSAGGAGRDERNRPRGDPCDRLSAAAGTPPATNDKRESPNDAATRAITGTRVAAADGAHIVDRLMGVLANEARQCLAEGVVRSPDDIDFALLAGAGFPAFRGGLFRWTAGRPQTAAIA